MLIVGLCAPVNCGNDDDDGYRHSPIASIMAWVSTIPQTFLHHRVHHKESINNQAFEIPSRIIACSYRLSLTILSHPHPHSCFASSLQVLLST